MKTRLNGCGLISVYCYLLFVTIPAPSFIVYLKFSNALNTKRHKKLVDKPCFTGKVENLPAHVNQISSVNVDLHGL